MKTKIILVIISWMLLLSINHSFSQVAFNKPGKGYTHLNADAVTDTNAFNLKSFASNIKVQRSFISHFGEAVENNWSMVGNNFFVRFHSNGLPTIALFAKNGYLFYSIMYGSEKDLPADVRKTVKSEFYDYTITLTMEVKENGRDVWIVELDNPREIITVSLEDGDMEKIQQIQKLSN